MEWITTDIDTYHKYYYSLSVIIIASLLWLKLSELQHITTLRFTEKMKIEDCGVYLQQHTNINFFKSASLSQVLANDLSL